MPEDPFELALRRRIKNYLAAEARVTDRLRQLEQERQQLRDRRAAAERLYDAEFGRTGSADEETLTESGRRNSWGDPDGPLSAKGWDDAIADVLQEAGGPLHVRQIWERLEAGGFQTEARDPLRSIAAVVIRSHRFAKGGPNIYGLINEGGGRQPTESGS